MRRLNLVLLATLQLSGVRSASFSIHDDLLAFPQFEVVFSDESISEQDAKSLLERNAYVPQPTNSAGSAQSTATEARSRAASSVGNHGSTTTTEAYELLNMDSRRYLCSIPIFDSPEHANHTENELAKAEEAREVVRATSSGWQMISPMADGCLYFVDGWWSYHFCKNREIVQFHALSAPPNGQPPRRDQASVEYVLGRVPVIPATAQQQARREAGDDPLPAEVQSKYDQRYLVQKLEGGTVCDLTNRERTIEVQYHCVPGMKSDQIAWIKEVTICAYLMVVHTPRLCDDVAFLPPDDNRANSISCHLIVDGAETGRLLLDDHGLPVDDFESASRDGEPLPEKEVAIGSVIVGSRNLLSAGDETGKPPLKLKPPRGFLGGAKQKQLTELIARAASREDGGKVEILTDEQLEQMDIDIKDIEAMKEELEKIAGDAGWTVEIVDLPGDLRELRGYVDDDEEDAPAGEPKGGQAEKEDVGSKEDNKKKNKKAKENEGSEEKYFKEEL